MNDIYLIRHTTPSVAKGICYGQTDLGITETFAEEASLIQEHLPTGIKRVHSSPLQRCALLAQQLFPDQTIEWEKDLMEVHCGQWEMQAWDALPKEAIDPWMADFVHVRIPGGESYLDLQERVMRCWEKVLTLSRAGEDQAIVAHGGVIRSILSGITGTPLIDSFKAFVLHYGCVVRVAQEEGRLVFEILHNLAPADKEQHKPKSFYK